MKPCAVLALAAGACAGGAEVTITDISGCGYDAGEIEAMVSRVCPSCEGGLVIHLWPRESFVPEEHRDLLGEPPVINVRWGGCISNTTLAHELVHWRLTQLTGDGDEHHKTVDWYLVRHLNDEMQCVEIVRDCNDSRR